MAYLTDTEPAQMFGCQLDLGLLASQTEEVTGCDLRSPSLESFATAALDN